MHGIDVLRALRHAKNGTPVIVVTKNERIEMKVQCFSAGADDYLIQPYHKDELIARLRTIVRRTKGHPQSLITIGNLAVDFDTKRVTVRGENLYLTRMEHSLLELLVLRRDSLVTSELALDYLYGDRNAPDIKTVDVFICRLRKKLKAVNDGVHYIETVWARGYTLVTPKETTVVQMLHPLSAV